MEIEEVEVIIDEHGKVQIHVRGVKGEQCLTLTESLSMALGGELIEQEMTPELYDQELPLDLRNRIERKTGS